MATLAEQRLARVRAAMAEWGADLLVLNFGPDFLYATGMQGPMYYTILKGGGDWATCAIVGQERDPVILLHPTFAVGVDAWVDDVRVMPEDADPQHWLADALAEFAPAGKTIAAGKMLWAETLLAVQQAAPSARFIPATNAMMDRMRAVKDEHELALMARAAEIADVALAETLKRMRPGMTERDVAIEVEHQIRLAGGDGPSFAAGIIAVGNGSDPQRHIFTRNTGQRLEPGMTVAFDFGALYQGYCSDFGRSAFIGEPNPEELAAYEAITTGNQALMPLMRDGAIAPAELADAMRDHVAARGFGEWYLYGGLGHSIGLEVHEEPWLRPPYDEPIRTNMVFTVEPKVWKPGVFYVRCEDMVVVGPDGARPLTHAPYAPNVVD
ncbi:MAG TPA: Xaa-Pro peptidase family protein [Thermomicrobiales bacterium]|jgi:Xaa-Pro aminopeptidase|nr:Xaa-Pro peptidase family protein [Thermomicrobiales bacterium]